MSERELDDFKHRATVAMASARDRFITRARTVAEVSYSEAHLALLRCRTEGEVERIERGFVAGMQALKGAIDGAR